MASDEHLSAIKGAKVLLVGASGIGFELLNNLVLYGFQDVHIIGLDTVEIRNLDRQWHVRQSNANVAQDAALNITFHANVKDPRFNINFYKEFGIVLNGLNNLDARHHVNCLCLAAGVPLVETETEGFLGLVSVHLKGKTQCYDCQPRPAPETYPVRTITSTPSKFGHCIVWAKDQLFIKIFGEKNLENDLNMGSNDAGDFSEHSEDVFERKNYEDIEHYGRRIYNHVFGYSIEVVLINEFTGQSCIQPRPISCIKPRQVYGEDVVLDNLAQQNGNMKDNGQVSAMASLGLKNPADVWSLEENSRVFLEALKLFFVNRPKEIGNLTFDRDDQLAMEFVTAAANIQASSFGIPSHSLSEAKGIAGSILHAVSTTNSIIAGRIIIEAIKVLQQENNNCLGVSSPGFEAKRKSWSREEDKILIDSWLNVSKDQTIGPDQKPTAFWQRVADYYNKFQSSGPLRSRSQCRCHWQKISSSVCKFVACHNQAKQNQKGDESEQDVLSAAHAIYKSDMKKAFIYEHAWHLLKKQQKWKSYALQSSSLDSDSSKRSKINERGDYSSSSNPGSSPTSHGIEDESIIRETVNVTPAKRKGKQRVVAVAADNNEKKLSSGQLKREWMELKKQEIEAKVEANRLKKYSMLLELTNKSALTPVQKLIHDKFRIFALRLP